MFDALKSALETTGYKFALFSWSKAPSWDYGVIAPDDEEILRANNRRAEYLMSGTVTYFTRDPSNVPRTTIEAVLDEQCVTWDVSYIDYEEDTGYIHYEWEFSCGDD